MHEEAAPSGSSLPDVDIAGILQLIPHRHPFLLVDRVVGMEAFKRARGIKNVTINEPFFPGHFPTDPIMPGVLIVEAMAQTAAVLVIGSLGAAAAGSLVYFMSVENARFRRPVRPGDRLELEIEVLRSKLGVSKFKGRAQVDGSLAAEAEFTAKILGS